MGTSLPFILISIFVIVIAAVFVFLTGPNRGENRLTPLAGLAFGFILAGVLFKENRIFGYVMLGIGILIAVVDILVRGRKG